MHYFFMVYAYALSMSHINKYSHYSIMSGVYGKISSPPIPRRTLLRQKFKESHFVLLVYLLANLFYSRLPIFQKWVSLIGSVKLVGQKTWKLCYFRL